ncbi:MAG: DUF998 domain-containing protein [Thermoplasmatales archaeon]|nr:MAG: DUF998 domain-containing protein [Thermoplasmatales archaeon]
MSSKQPVIVKISGLCGIFSPIVAFVCISFAIYHSDWYTWTGNWLSDLGGIPGETPIWASRGIASVIFNSGLIIAGVMGMVFASNIRKIRMLNTRLGRIGTLFLILDMFALCAVGIFPETTGNMHTLVALIFFVLVALSLLTIGTAVRKSSGKTLGWFVTLLGAITLCSFPFLFIPQPWGSNAVIEMFPIVSISAFAIVFGIGLLIDKVEIIQPYI